MSSSSPQSEFSHIPSIVRLSHFLSIIIKQLWIGQSSLADFRPTVKLHLLRLFV
jgi:hypothetical protein